MKKMLKYCYLLVFIVSGTFLFTGCNNEEEPTITETGTDQINVQVIVNGIDEDFDDNQTRLGEVESMEQEFKLDEEHTLVASISSETSSLTRAQTSLNQGIKYRVIAYRGNDISSESYVNSAEFVIGESNPDFLLPSGSYTFVCYSNNNNSSPFFDQNAITLPVEGGTDFLYEKKTVNISSDMTQFGITFKHSFTMANVTIDASATGKKISACKASIQGSQYRARISLSDGSYVTEGNSVSTPFQFLSLNAGIITSENTIFISDQTRNTQLKIDRLQIDGGSSYENKIFDLGKSMKPGKRYNITFTVKKNQVIANKVIRVLCHQDANGVGVGTINPSFYYSSDGLRAMLENKDNFGNNDNSVIKCKGFEFTYMNFMTTTTATTSLLDNYDVILITYRPYFGAKSNENKWTQAIKEWMNRDPKRVLIVTLDDTGGYSSRPLLAQFGISTRYYAEGGVTYTNRPIADINDQTLKKYRIIGNNPFAARDNFVFNPSLNFGGASGTDGVYGYALSSSNLTPIIYGNLNKSHTFIGIDFPKRVVVLGEVETLGTKYATGKNYIGMPHNYVGTPQGASIKDGWYLMAGIWGWVVNTVSGEYAN